jgi:methyl-accepting chemotaxis protein
MNVKRRIYLIDKKFQLKYLFYVIFVLVLVSIAISSIVYFTTWFSVVKEFSAVKLHQDLSNIVRMREYEGVRTMSNIETIPILKEEAKMLSNYQIKIINEILKKTNKRIFFTLIIILLSIIILGIFITHRVAGPLFRINKELTKLTEGNFDVNFTLRKKDELKPIAEKLQFLTQKLQKFKHFTQELEKTKLTNEQKKILENISVLFKQND